MIFFGNGVVWDAEFNKPLCKFVEGKYETKDARICDILRRTHPYNVDEEFEQEGTPSSEVEEVEEVEEYKCFLCDFIAKSYAGLKSHETNKHRNKKR